MLTAAVRDLHLHYPHRFITDVRTCFPDLWLNNPYITPIDDGDPAAELLECSCPLIQRSNQLPYHYIHAFIHFLNQTLDLNIMPTAFHGDLYLSDTERTVPAGLKEASTAGYWLIASGGKYDCTIKWWNVQRYQEVVDHFKGRIHFVQVGDAMHFHPPLKGVVDFRGRTTLRDLVRLVYFAAGCVTPVSLMMHLAAAVESPKDYPPRRPCVVIAGGREPPHWEAYPTHAFLHTVGMLPCCASGGCWKQRVKPLEDEDERDCKSTLCVDVKNELPHCMDMITSQDVINAIERYQLLRPSKTYPTTVKRQLIDDAELPVQFILVTDWWFSIGTFATCRSIRLCDSTCKILIVSNNISARGLSHGQKATFKELGADVLDADVFYAPGRNLAPWELKSYTAYDIARTCRSEVIVGIDSDMILCSNIADIVNNARATGRFVGGHDGAQHYDKTFSVYGLRVPAINNNYMSTSLYVCPVNSTNIKILEQWAMCCSRACFNGRGPYPGHGDQGVLNAIIMRQLGKSSVVLLENRLWSQHGTYWSDTVSFSSNCRYLCNNSYGAEVRQRALHCGGTTKFWDVEHSSKLGNHKGQIDGYCWFLFLISPLFTNAHFNERVAASRHLAHDYNLYNDRITLFSEWKLDIAPSHAESSHESRYPQNLAYAIEGAKRSHA
jgi:hypothetical protein